MTLKSGAGAVALLSLLSSLFVSLQAVAQSLPPEAQRLLDKARASRWYAQAQRLNPEIRATSDQRSFLVIWKPGAAAPERWVVSLHGSNGFATDDLAVWHPHLAGRGIGLVTIQWWHAGGDNDYYAPEQIYRELDIALRQIGVRPGSAMLHGFSRGSANLYAVAALDSVRPAPPPGGIKGEPPGGNFKGGPPAGFKGAPPPDGPRQTMPSNRYFTLFVANAGRANSGYPPNRAIEEGRFGPRPLTGTRWVTVCGERDPNPERDGCPGMRATAQWLATQGGQVMIAIEDPQGDHGAFHLNPRNVQQVLNAFSDMPVGPRR